MSSCNKQELVSVNGVVSGKLLDAATNTGLADVAITVQGTKIKTTSKTDGTYVINGIPSGEYLVLFTKSGYMINKREVTIDLSGASAKKSNSVKYPILEDDDYLYPLTGKANGVVLNIDGTLSSGATVMINFNDSTFTTTTDANGSFSFTTLPFEPGNYVYARAIKGDLSAGDNDNYDATSTRALGFKITLTRGDFTFLYGNYDKTVGNKNFPINSDIELYFSDVIDLATTLKYGGVQLNDSHGIVLADITTTGNKMIINPKNDLANNTNYWLSGNVYANEYRSASVGGQSFTTVSLTSLVTLDFTTKPTITMDAGKTLLTITCPTGTKYLNIYKTSGTNTEFNYYTWITVSSSTATYNISADPSPTSYYVIPEGVDANNQTIYGAQSAVITK